MKLLTNRVAERGVKSAVRAGAQKIADAAQRNAERVDNPATENYIPANVAVQFASKSSTKTGNVRYRVGILGGARPGAERVGALARRLSGKGLPGGETWYWRFVEFGTSKMRARPFMRPAAETQAGIAAEEVATVLEQFLDRTVKSL